MTELVAFKPLVGGVLKVNGLTRSHPQYDDYFQELMLILWERLANEPDLAPTHNTQLFRFLLWRLKDMQREEWLQQSRCQLKQEVDAGFCEDVYMGMWYALKQQLPLSLQPIYQHVLDYPDLTLQARSRQLAVNRKTLRRRLDMIGRYIK